MQPVSAQASEAEAVAVIRSVSAQASEAETEIAVIRSVFAQAPEAETGTGGKGADPEAAVGGAAASVGSTSGADPAGAVASGSEIAVIRSVFAQATEAETDTAEAPPSPPLTFAGQRPSAPTATGAPQLGLTPKGLQAPSSEE